MKTNYRNMLPLSYIAAFILTSFASTLYAKPDPSAAQTREQAKHDMPIAHIHQDRESAGIHRSIEEIIENGCGPMGVLEAFQQAQYEGGERAYPPVRVQVLAVADKLREADNDTVVRLGREVMHYRDDFRSGKILMTEFQAALQRILEQI